MENKITVTEIVSQIELVTDIILNLILEDISYKIEVRITDSTADRDVEILTIRTDKPIEDNIEEKISLIMNELLYDDYFPVNDFTMQEEASIESMTNFINSYKI